MRSTLLAVMLLGALIGYLLVVPWSQTADTLGRLGPIMLFLATISIVINLAASAGLFRWVAQVAARGPAERGIGLWLLVVALSVISTVFLSLDTTAVLVTPLVLALAARSGTDPIPLALTVVWLANTGSLLLPVSNLTNLLAVETDAFTGTGDYIRQAAVPAVVAIAVTVVFAGWVFRRRLRHGRPGRLDDGILYPAEPAGPQPGGSPAPGGPDTVASHRLLLPCGIVVAVLLPLLTTSIPFWWSTSVAAAILVAIFAVVDRTPLRLNLIPWPAIGLAAGLVFAVQLVHTLGAEELVRSLLAGDASAGALFGLAGAGALASNVVNNIPAYLLLEPAADSGTGLIALLIGANAGPIVTPWASLATLLWADQLRRGGLAVSWRRFAAFGAVLAVATVALATGALALSS